MDITCHQALLGFCLDLTDPESDVIPVGMILIGETDELRFAAAASVVASDELSNLDPVSRALLEDVPTLIEEQLQELVASQDSSEPRDLLVSMHNLLRNSLHVIEIEGPNDLQIAESQLSTQLIGRLRERLHDELKSLRANRQPELQHRPEEASRAVILPERTSFWPLEQGNSPRASVG